MKLFLSVLFLLFLSISNSSPLTAQFYTLKPTPRESFHLISKSPKEEKERESSKNITNNNSENPNSLIGFSLPIDLPIVVNSKYGYRTDPITRKKAFHHGIDLKTNSSTILSMLGGRVKKTGYDRKGLGNYITMLYGDFEVTYGHLSSIFVSPKDIVRPGAPLGLSGSTGRSTGEHLHLSLKLKGKRVDPLPFLLFIQKRVSQKQDISITN